MSFEELLIECDGEGLCVKEKPLRYNDGRIKGNRVAIRSGIDTSAEKCCVLAEELGHHMTNSGDILDQNLVENRKQEHKARLWSYDHLIGLNGIVEAAKAGCRSRFEIAEFLGVTEKFLQGALEKYQQKYGTNVCHHGYKIWFDPVLRVTTLR